MFSNKKFFYFANIHDYVDSRDFDIYEEEWKNLKFYLEAKDEAIFNSSWRLHQGYYAHDKKERTIITEFGAITIKRRRYHYYEGKQRKSICLLDDEVGINPREHFYKSLKQRIAQIATSGNSYRDILEKFKNAGISAMTVSRIVNNF